MTKHAHYTPDRMALVEAAAGRRWTDSMLNEASCGVKAGDRVRGKPARTHSGKVQKRDIQRMARERASL